MGLTILPKVASIIKERKKIVEIYDSVLPKGIVRPTYQIVDFEYNYAYLPVVFENERLMLKARENLAAKEINVRRYFYPSLNKVPQTAFLNYSCPISESISNRVVCLPLYVGLKQQDIELIAGVIKGTLK